MCVCMGITHNCKLIGLITGALYIPCAVLHMARFVCLYPEKYRRTERATFVFWELSLLSCLCHSRRISISNSININPVSLVHSIASLVHVFLFWFCLFLFCTLNKVHRSPLHWHPDSFLRPGASHYSKTPNRSSASQLLALL
ncbi:hypothetical protein AMELA_G00159410 [Ameiurus melas]|uniref:Uncharacterized protein n=1 Tax=Ameiurus melas TaxID=219545 RepID=A0A7J6AHE5_AMEME|nr:hypothetical protein AMELA_G00159410 [Ameiurus melas]